MTPEQALAVLASLANSPAVKMAFAAGLCTAQDLAHAQAAVAVLADAIKPKPENATPLPELGTQA